MKLLNIFGITLLFLFAGVAASTPAEASHGYSYSGNYNSWSGWSDVRLPYHRPYSSISYGSRGYAVPGYSYGYSYAYSPYRHYNYGAYQPYSYGYSYGYSPYYRHYSSYGYSPYGRYSYSPYYGRNYW